MQLKHLVEPILSQLAQTINIISTQQYTAKCNLLNGSTIGGHTRHIIELFQCLQNGYVDGVVNYEKRKRDNSIETTTSIAHKILQDIISEIDKENINLKLEGSFNTLKDEDFILTTNYYREVIYNLEHTIHHMALIRVGINELGNIKLPENFGVAPSTIKYKQLCAQ